MPPEATRQVALDQWGRALLEELLFRAAESVSARPSASGSVEVELSFRLTPRVDDDSLEIRAECSAEPALVTRLMRPF